MISRRAAILVNTYGCSFHEIPEYYHDKFYLIDSKDPLLNNLNGMPDCKGDIIHLTEHVYKNIAPNVFHQIHIIHNVEELAAIKEACEEDPKASYIFVGAIPDSYRPILSGKTVRVANQFQDLRDILDGLLETQTNSFATYAKKEYTADTLHSPQEGKEGKYFNMYAERFFQSSKDMLRVIQSATGPLPTLTSIHGLSRKSSKASAIEEEVKRLVHDGIMSLILGLNFAESIWGRIRMGNAGLELTGELAAMLNKSIFLSSDELKNVRVIVTAVNMKNECKIDWSPLVKYFCKQQLACHLAVSVVDPVNVNSRHFKSIYGLITRQPVYKQIDAKYFPELNLTAKISVHEYVHIEAEISDDVQSIRSLNPSITVSRVEIIGRKVRLELETHISTSRCALLQVFTTRTTAYWNLDTEIVADHTVQVKVYKRDDRNLIHVRAKNVKIIEYIMANKSTTLCVSPNSYEWLIHVPCDEELSCISAQTIDNRIFRWTGEHLRRSFYS